MSTFDGMTKAQLIARLKNREMRVTELFEENVKLKRQLKTTEERWALASKLEGIMGADLDGDEEEAIHDAIALICPEYARMRDDEEQESADWLNSTTPEEQQKFIEQQTGRPFDPEAIYKKIGLRFGEEKKK